jgi:hypothetical protein
MRRSLLAALTAFMMLAWPASAEEEHVLLDMTLMALPQAPTRFCSPLGTGTLSVTVRAVGDGEPRPVTFDLYSVRNVDPDANLTTDIGLAEATHTTQVKGDGEYCLSVTNNAPTSGPSASIAELSGLRQDVDVRITLTP